MKNVENPYFPQIKNKGVIKTSTVVVQEIKTLKRIFLKVKNVLNVCKCWLYSDILLGLIFWTYMLTEPNRPTNLYHAIARYTLCSVYV